MNKNPLASIHNLKSALPLITALLCLTTLTAFSQKPEIYVSTGHSGSVSTVAFSPDGKTLASGSEDNTVRLWDIGSGQEFKALKGHTSIVNSVAFSPDGKALASGSSDNTIRLWDVNSGQELKTLLSNFGSVNSLAFSPDGKTLASGRSDHTIKLWDVASGEELRTLKGHSDLVVSVAFSPDGKTLASGSWDKTIKLWNVGSGQELKTLKGHSKEVTSVAISPDGKTLASGSSDSTIKLWDVPSRQELKTLTGHSNIVFSVAFSPDGSTLASGSSDRSAKIWDVISGKELKTFKGFLTTVMTVAFSPDSKTLAIVNRDRTVKIRDIASGQEIKTLKSHSSAVALVAFSPDGKMLAAVTRHNNITLWDVASGQAVKTLKGVGTDIADIMPGRANSLSVMLGRVNSLSFSSDGKTIASGSQGGSIKLWDVTSGQELKTLEGYMYRGRPTPVMGIAFIADEKVLASVYRDSTIKLWDVISGQVLKTMKEDDLVLSATFSPNGRTLAIGSKLLDVASGQELKSFDGHWYGSLSFSPDGKTIAIGGIFDGDIKLWDLASGQELVVLKGHSAAISSVAFSPTGKMLASGSEDNTVKLWNVGSGKEIKALTNHSNGVNSVAFSSDGTTLASGSGDATTKLWDVTRGNNIASLIALDEKDWVVVTPDGRFDGSPDGMKLISYVQDNKLLPLDSFFDQFFTPNLLQKVYAREASPATTSKVDFSKPIKLPPVVRITSPTPGSESNSDTAQLTVEANDQGGGVEDIRLYQNGKLLDRVTRQLVQDKKANTRTFEVSLLPGVNTFRATAFNSDRTEAVPDEIKIELKAVEASANLYILAVGLNEYKNTRYNLNYGNADAKAFADAVAKRGKNIFKEIIPKVIFDAEASNAGIKAEFDDIIKKARPQDVFVFFYAGHGAMSEGDDKKAADFYLVPYDVVSIFGDGGNLVAKGIAATDLREMSRKIRALKQLIVIDACQSGGAVETFAMVRGPAEEKAIQQLARSAGVTVLASAGQQQVATEFSKLGHGVFTYTLLKGLNGEADGSPMDGKVTISELKAYLDDQVPEMTKLHRGKSQYPNSFTRGQDFPIGVK